MEEIGVKTCALTDHGTISGCVDFFQALQKKGFKPILGNELYCSPNSKTRPQAHLPVLAKNKRGWKTLIQITSKANNPDNFYYKPRISVNELNKIIHNKNDLIGFSGHLGSHIANALEENMETAEKTALILNDVFGQGNFFLEVQLMDHKANPDQKRIAKQVRELSQKLGIPCIATPDAHYAFQNQAIDQRILLCTNMHVTMEQAQNPDFQLKGFFKSQNYHIPSYDEMISYGHTEEELANTNMVADICEEYEITNSPILPEFPCPSGFNSESYIRHLCSEGMARHRLKGELYKRRLDMELSVLKEANLFNYFLIVRDILQFCNSNGVLTGPGRGSAAGCLVSYLIGITKVDPIKYDLIFERFYDVSRKGSLPDIDVDIEARFRDKVIDYIKEKYGQDRVSQMITYQTMMGRRALKDVFRAYNKVSFEEINRITDNIPDKARIAAELQEMQEATGESSVIKWALENTPDKFAEWVSMDENGNLTGDFALEFEQAIRLEGTKAAISKHAAGVVIGDRPLSELCPMVYDTKEKRLVAGLEMNNLESLGLVKLDILGLSLLNKMSGISNILEYGDIA